MSPVVDVMAVTAFRNAVKSEEAARDRRRAEGVLRTAQGLSELDIEKDWFWRAGGGKPSGSRNSRTSNSPTLPSVNVR